MNQIRKCAANYTPSGPDERKPMMSNVYNTVERALYDARVRVTIAVEAATLGPRLPISPWPPTRHIQAALDAVEKAVEKAENVCFPRRGENAASLAVWYLRRATQDDPSTAVPPPAFREVPASFEVFRRKRTRNDALLPFDTPLAPTPAAVFDYVDAATEFYLARVRNMSAHARDLLEIHDVVLPRARVFSDEAVEKAKAKTETSVTDVFTGIFLGKSTANMAVERRKAAERKAVENAAKNIREKGIFVANPSGSDAKREARALLRLRSSIQDSAAKKAWRAIATAAVDGAAGTLVIWRIRNVLLSDPEVSNEDIVLTALIAASLVSSTSEEDISFPTAIFISGIESKKDKKATTEEQVMKKIADIIEVKAAAAASGKEEKNEVHVEAFLDMFSMSGAPAGAIVPDPGSVDVLDGVLAEIENIGPPI